MSLKILTANHLVGGQVVFLNDDREWSSDICNAHLAGTEDEAAAIDAIGKLGEAHAIIVGPYLIEVKLDEAGNITPVRLRERLRLNGPSIRPDLATVGGEWRLGV